MSGLPKAFLEHITANMDDDAPRLMYADFLEEHGQSARAEFIRVQVERTRLPAWDAAQVRLRLREQALFQRHGEEWLAEVPAVEGARWEGFRRGIVAEVSFASFEAMRKSAHDCRALAPVEAVTVRWPRQREGREDTAPIAELRELSLTGRPNNEDEIGWLADSPQLSTLRVLTARGLWVGGLSRLVASPHLDRLRALRLPANNLGNAGILALIGAASLRALAELDLTGRDVSGVYREDAIVRAPGMEALAQWEGLKEVRSLNLSYNDVGRPGLLALLRSPYVGTLQSLFLRSCRLDGQAMVEFVEAPAAPRLSELDLGENVLKDSGVAHLASARCLRELKALWLDRCEIPLSGARSLAKKAAFLDGLRLLDVSHNHFGPRGLEGLLERRPPALHTLWLRDNDLYDNGAALLAGSPASGALLDVDLSRNELGDAAAHALGESPHLRNLLVLRLTDNPISEEAAAALAASPLGRRLALLELEDTPAPPAADWHDMMAEEGPGPNERQAPAPPPPAGDEIPF